MQYPQGQDDEIDLGRCLDILIKRKWLVLTVFAISIIIAAAYGFARPKVYEISMIIEPPISSITDSGVQNAASMEDIKAKIELGAFNEKIVKDLNLPDQALQFKVTQPKDTRLIKVSIQRRHEGIAQGMAILAELTQALILDHAPLAADRQAKVTNQIKLMLSQIDTKQNEVQLRAEELKMLRERELQLFDEIKDTKINSEKLLAARAPLLDKASQHDDVSAILYTTTIQQNIAYFTELEKSLFDVRTTKKQTSTAIENLRNSINEDRIQIEKLTLLKGEIRNISQLQEPVASPYPIGPRKIHIILLGGLLGLMIGSFSAFFLESRRLSPACGENRA